MDLNNSSSKYRGKVSLIIPVLNEVENIAPLTNAIMALPQDSEKARIREIIFVDDGSTDGTIETIRSLGDEMGDIRITLKERKVKNGTVNAQIYGISCASTEAVIVMDGDLQHPVEYIPKLISKYFEGYDMVLASRYVRNGSANRKLIHGVISRGANIAAKTMLPSIRRVKDPISGFFIINRRLVNQTVEFKGFNKLALYILTGNRKLSVAEIPFNFIERVSGKSKVSTGGFSFMVKYISELRYYRHLHAYSRKANIGSRSQSDLSLIKN